MSCLAGLDGLELVFLRELGGCPVGREEGGAGLPYSGVEFLSEEGK